MVNTTVYPFGTGGELPASVGIINDLSTGGADKALSAEMGKKLGQNIIPSLTGIPNTQPLSLSDTADFESGNLTNGTGAESTSSTTIRSDYIIVYPGASIAFSTESGRVKIFQFDKDKGYLGNMTDWVAGSGSYVLSDNAAFIRICVSSGGSSAPVWDTVKLSVTPSVIYRFVAIEDAGQYAAIGSTPNFSPVPFAATDFENGNLNSSGGETSSNNTLRTKGFFQIFPGTVVNFSTAAGYGVKIFEYNEGKAFLSGMSSGEQSGSYTTKENAFYIRLVISNGQTGSWSDIQLSVIPEYTYEYVRAVAPEKIEKMIQGDLDAFANIELPILAPAPQLSANGDDSSDINAETMTSTEIQEAIEDVIAGLPIPDKYYSSTPPYGTIYDIVGRDASDQYDIKAYVFTRRNRYCWRASAALYAWVSGATVYYTDHRSPRVGDTVYTDANRTLSGYTVTAYNSAGPYATINGSQYTRDDTQKIAPDDIYTKDRLRGTTHQLPVYNKQGTSLGTASVVSFSELSFSNKTYNRYTSLDFHSENRATIVLWGNEHGPQSDPNEPSILLYRLAKDLCQSANGNPFLSFLKSYCKVVIIPAANPYGINVWAASGTEGRNNANGVNINRNYDTLGWSSEETGKGDYAGSEVETQFIMNTVLDIDPDIAIDIHCLGYVSYDSEGACHYSGNAPEGYPAKVKQVMLDACSLYFDQFNGASPQSHSRGYDWINSVGITGGLIEMNAGPVSNTYNGKQHTSMMLFADYTLLLNTLRMWYYQFDPTLDLRKLFVK